MRKAVLIGVVVVVATVVCGWSVVLWRRAHAPKPPAGPVALRPRPPLTPPPMAGPNAFDFYVRAHGALSEETHARVGEVRKLSMPEQRKLLAACQPALKLIRDGQQYPCRTPIVPDSVAVRPWLSRHRQLARILALEQSVRAHGGNYAGAVTSGIDAIQIGCGAQRDAPFVDYLAAASCQAIGRKHLPEYIPHLSETQAANAARRLEGLLADAPTLAYLFGEEKRANVTYLQRLIDDPEEMRAFCESDSERKIKATRKTFVTGRDDYTAHMDTLITMANTPYPQWRDPREPTNLLTIILAIDFRKCGMWVLVNDAQNRLLLTMLALHAYRAKHGTYPDTLTSLTPSFLATLPLDPYSDGQSLCYRRTGKDYVLYSIGPDARDDGGTPIDDPTRGDARHSVENDSTGDIVAGVNTVP